MRRLMMFNRVTADGYFASTEGNLDWAVPDDDLDRAAVDAMPGGDTILFGRVTYDNFESFWPKVVKSPSEASDPHLPRSASPAMHAMAKWIDEATKIVFSRTRKEVTWRNSRLFHEFDPREIENLKNQPGKDMIIFGSGTIVSELTTHGLIDEYQFVVTPILLGAGRQLFGALAKRTKLDLAEVKQYRSGNVVLRYTLSK